MTIRGQLELQTQKELMTPEEARDLEVTVASAHGQAIEEPAQDEVGLVRDLNLDPRVDQDHSKS